MNDSTIVVLEEELLRKLAEAIWYQEIYIVKPTINFDGSEHELDFIHDCKSNYESAISLLDSGAELVRTYENDKDKSSIAHDIFTYLIYCDNIALQLVNNCKLRKEYLVKISAHSTELTQKLADLDPMIAQDVEDMAKDAIKYRNSMLEYIRKAQSPASRGFSESLKENGTTYQELVERYMAKLGYEGPFDQLEDEAKIKVYAAIIEASGRGNIFVNGLAKGIGAAGLALLVVSAGLMVWDIFTAAHVFQTAVHDALVTAASYYGGELGEVAGAAAGAAIADAFQASAILVAVAGIVGSIAGAFLIGAFVGLVIDWIFSGGRDSIPDSTSGIRCYAAPMPDGTVIARQLVHG